MEIKQHVSKHLQVTEEIKREIKIPETNDNENTTAKTYGIQQKQFSVGSL